MEFSLYSQVNHLFKQSLLAQNLKNYAQAIHILESISALSQRFYDPSSRNSLQIKLHFKLGVLHQLTKDVNLSRESFLNCLKIPRKTSEDSILVSESYLELGKLSSSYVEAGKYFAKAIGILTSECKVSTHYMHILNQATFLLNNHSNIMDKQQLC